MNKSSSFEKSKNDYSAKLMLQLHDSIRKSLLVTDIVSRILCVFMLIVAFPLCLLISENSTDESSFFISNLLTTHLITYFILVFVWLGFKRINSKQLHMLFSEMLAQSNPEENISTRALIKWRGQNSIDFGFLGLLQTREPLLWLCAEIIVIFLISK